MRRVTSVMRLHSGQKDEYRRRHNQIWPELVELLSSYGFSDYDIYLHEASGYLFASYTVDEKRCATEDLVREPVLRRWWEYMQDIMETNEDASPVSDPLELMFHMD